MIDQQRTPMLWEQWTGDGLTHGVLKVLGCMTGCHIDIVGPSRGQPSVYTVRHERDATIRTVVVDLSECDSRPVRERPDCMAERFHRAMLDALPEFHPEPLPQPIWWQIDRMMEGLRAAGLTPAGLKMSRANRRALAHEVGGDGRPGCQVSDYAGLPVAVIDEEGDGYLAVTLKDDLT